MLVSVMEPGFRFQCDYHVHQLRLNQWSLLHWNPLEHTHGRHMCLLVLVHDPCQKYTEWLLHPLHQVGEDPWYSAKCPPAIPSIWYSIQLWECFQSHLIPLPSTHSGGGSSFPSFVPPDYMINSESLVGIEPGDSMMVIGYQVEEFTNTCLAEHFVPELHIYSGFMGKM